jgi:hypothetical protein
MFGDQLTKIVEQYSRQHEAIYGDIKITRIADQKTVFVEQIGADGRAIMLTKVKVDGTTYWAGFSTRSQTVYISLAT